MRKKNCLLLCFSFITTLLYAQLYNQQWYFGDQGAINFNSVPPAGVVGSAIITPEGSASVSDKTTGALLFYTDGITVWDANNAVMPNGTGLLGGVPASQNPNNPLSSTSAAVIVPKPFTPNIYYVITIDQEDSDNGLRYSVVDMTLNGGLGDVVPAEKNIFLYNAQSEKIHVVPISSGCGYWLISHDKTGNTFIVFKIDQSGISTTPVLSSVGLAQPNGRGFMKANRQANKIAMGYSAFPVSRVELFDFDAATGRVTGVLSWRFNFPFSGVAFSVEFSPDGTKLYVNNYAQVVQYDISSNNPALIESSASNISQLFGFTQFVGAMQLGPDGKMYLATDPVASINNPDNAGVSCNLQTNAIVNPQGSAKLGLPQWIYDLQVVVPVNDILYEGGCIGDNILFSLQNTTTIQSVQWNFDDPGSGSANTSASLTPEHLFFNAGTYNVTATINYPCTTVVINKVVEIRAFANPVFNPVPSICPGTVASPLPDTSLNGIAGTWAPPFNNATTTTYTFTPTNNNCAGTATLTVSVSTPLVPVFNAIPEFCAGSIAPTLPPISTNGITGTWSPAIINNTISGTYVFTPDPGQCTDGTTVQLSTTVIRNDTLNNILFDNNCQFKQTNFTLSRTQGIDSVKWTFGEPSLGINNIATGFSPSHMYTSPGSFTVAASISTSCANYTVDTIIQIQPSTALTFSINNTFITGQPVPPLPATSANGIPGTWSPAVIDNQNSGSYTFTPSIPGCYIDSIFYIFIVDEITPTFNPIIAICAGSTPPSLPSTSLNGITGTWSPAVIDNTASGLYTFTPSPGQSAAVVTMYIEVFAAGPSITLASASGTDNQSVCVNQFITDIVYTLGGPASGANITGLPPGIVGSVSGTVLTLFGFPLESTNSPYVYTIITTGGNCGSDTITGVINVNNTPVPVFNPIPAVCEGSSAPVLPDTSANGVVGSWSPSAVSTAVSGTYTFTPNAGQCSTPAPVQVSITVIPLTIPVFNPVPSFCKGANPPVLPLISINGITGTWLPAVVDSNASDTYLFIPDSGQCAVGASMFVEVKQPSAGTDRLEVCQTELPVSWNGNSYNSGGTYTVTLANAVGCDSVVTLNLIVKPVTFSNLTISRCQSQLPYTLNGNVYNSAGVYKDTLVSASGCDSVITLNLLVNQATASTTAVAICQGQLPYSWNGNIYSSAGVYKDTLVNAAGCDSVVTLNLLVNQTISSTTSISICTGQLPYSWNGNIYNNAGIYKDTLVSAGGCDSIATLNLLVNQATASTTSISICQNQLPYSWNGNVYNGAGVYKDTLVNSGGCDSIVTLNLLIKSTSASITSISICQDQLPYSWNGNSYTNAGVYKDTLVSSVGCDSIVTLNLLVKSTSESITSISICQDQLPYSWNGNLYDNSGIYKDTLVNSGGCDSLLTLNLLVKLPTSSVNEVFVCERQLPYSWNGNVYNSFGDYKDTLTNTAGCDSVVQLLLLLKKADSSQTNVRLCPNQFPYSWNGSFYSSYGSYRAVVLSAGGCDSIIKLELIPDELTPKPVLPGDTTLCRGNLAVLTPGMYSSYLWQDSSKLSTYTVTQPGNYFVIVKDVNGCADTARVNIQYDEYCNDLYFPNAFTPNGDGLNDSFGPVGNFAIVNFYSLRIFNRYGEVVFGSTNPLQKWDGVYKSKLTAGNSFVWVAEYVYRGGIKKVRKGNILLIK